MTLRALILTVSFVALTAQALGAPATSSHGKAPAAAVDTVAVSEPPKPAAAPAAPKAAPVPRLIGDAIVTAEIVTFGDLIPGLPDAQGRIAAFRAPALGQTGTIQAARIAEAAAASGLPVYEAGTVAQVIVTRAARRIGSGEIELAIKQAVEERNGVDARALAMMFDGGSPSLAVEPELTQGLSVQDIVYDQRTRRISAVMVLPGSAATRLKPLKVSGQLVETMEVVLPTRAITRGETIASSDVTLERRPREGLGADLVGDLQGAIGKAVRRPLLPGQPLRAGDIQRQEVVARGDIVNMTFEAPGLVVSMRGKANEAGAVGDVIAVQNIQSKRIIQATITGAGKVTANPGATNRVASVD